MCGIIACEHFVSELMLLLVSGRWKEPYWLVENRGYSYLYYEWLLKGRVYSYCFYEITVGM